MQVYVLQVCVFLHIYVSQVCLAGVSFSCVSCMCVFRLCPAGVLCMYLSLLVEDVYLIASQLCCYRVIDCMYIAQLKIVLCHKLHFNSIQTSVKFYKYNI